MSNAVYPPTENIYFLPSPTNPPPPALLHSWRKGAQQEIEIFSGDFFPPEILTKMAQVTLSLDLRRPWQSLAPSSITIHSSPPSEFTPGRFITPSPAAFQRLSTRLCEKYCPFFPQNPISVFAMHICICMYESRDSRAVFIM